MLILKLQPGTRLDVGGATVEVVSVRRGKVYLGIKNAEVRIGPAHAAVDKPSRKEDKDG